MIIAETFYLIIPSFSYHMIPERLTRHHFHSRQDTLWEISTLYYQIFFITYNSKFFLLYDNKKAYQAPFSLKTSFTLKTFYQILIKTSKFRLNDTKYFHFYDMIPKRLTRLHFHSGQIESVILVVGIEVFDQRSIISGNKYSVCMVKNLGNGSIQNKRWG